MGVFQTNSVGPPDASIWPQHSHAIAKVKEVDMLGFEAFNRINMNKP